MYTREREIDGGGDEKSAPPRENKTAREQPIEDEKEREREKEAVVVIVSKVEDLKSYHFFVVYLCVCFYVGDEYILCR
jgi:hypothetical protein|tara:strand:+ start:1551 stop:1784 length:234 start_codon:yes stop_codon:yes gene_type:complete